MAESVKVTLEVYSAPTFTLSTPRRTLPGVVGDDVSFVVTCSAVGSFANNVKIGVIGAPSGAVVTYSPVNQLAGPGESVTITINTDSCSAGTTTMTIGEVA
jgi:hypothetical protein